ncbi:hypothetical protein HKD37_06G014537 [Glycine soja]
MEEGKEWSVKEKNETTTRPSLKSDVPFNKYELWKHKEEEDIVKCAFQDIVSDELNKIKRTDELLWEYEDLECDIETWEDEVDEYLARAVFEHMQLNEDEAHGKEIWCPICKQGELKDSHNLIHCTRCELQLNKASEVLIFTPFVNLPMSTHFHIPL